MDFFDTARLAARIDEALEQPQKMKKLRQAARATAVERFDLKRTVLPEWLALFDALAHGRRLCEKIAPPAPRRAAPSRGARRATG